MKTKTVTLTQIEMEMAVLVGERRQGQAERRGLKDNHGFEGTREQQRRLHIAGAIAEMAYCKARNQFWTGSIDSFKGADVGDNVQIRHTENGHLLPVRKEDNPDHFYVLVTGTPPTLTIHGYIQGSDAQNPQWWGTFGPNDIRPPCWKVPQHALLPIFK